MLWTVGMLNLKPGQKLCTTCVQNLKMQLSESSTDEEDNFELMNSTFDYFKENACLLECSPVKLSVGARDRVVYGKRKMRNIESAAKKQSDKIIKLDSIKKTCTKYDDLDETMLSLKSKIDIFTKLEQIELLSLVPSSRTLKETIEKFQVSERLVKEQEK